MQRDNEKTESHQQELGEDSEFAPLEQAEEEAAIAPIREGLIVPPRPPEQTPANEDRRVAESRPPRRSD